MDKRLVKIYVFKGKAKDLAKDLQKILKSNEYLMREKKAQ